MQESDMTTTVSTAMRRYALRFRWVWRRDGIQRMLRICRFVWQRGVVGDGSGYSAKLSLALRPALFSPVKRDAVTDWRLTVLGLRVHYCRSYGGVMA